MNSTHPFPKTIYTFWEPRHKLTPYLELCMQTWKKNLPDYEIITLNYANLGEYIDEQTFNYFSLQKMRLMLQKDAIMVAVLAKNGGVF